MAYKILIVDDEVMLTDLLAVLGLDFAKRISLGYMAGRASGDAGRRKGVVGLFKLLLLAD